MLWEMQRKARPPVVGQHACQAERVQRVCERKLQDGRVVGDERERGDEARRGEMEGARAGGDDGGGGVIPESVDRR